MSVFNREYKDRLFNYLFGQEENKEWTLSLYNAVNGSHYTDPSLIQFSTIREVMYLSMHNDVSFLISDEMNLYEQQSSFNPNMPLRQLQIAGNLYEKYVKEHNKNKYGSRLIQLPVPKLVVFYNGVADKEDETILRLSDSFPEGADADIEVRVRMINVNYGRSQSILDICKPLKEYAWLVDAIRNGRGGADLETVAERVIKQMPGDFIIKPFLESHQAEVKGMLLTEYNEEETMRLFREEGREEGVTETLLALAKAGLISVTVGASRAGMTEDDFRGLMERYAPPS